MAMEYNPYIQPGKHFKPRPGGNYKATPHKGKWSLYYGFTLLLYNAYYGSCVKSKKEWNRHKGYRNIELFRIVPCVK